MDDTKKLSPKTSHIAQVDMSLLIDLCEPKLLRTIDELYQSLSAAPKRMAVGLSGGVDSATLALHLAVWAKQRNVLLHCFHVHHGLQSVADDWLNHVQVLALRLDTPCEIQRVEVDLNQGDGMESAARNARYLAFEQMAARTGVKHIYLAHHQDDQAETVLLRLLRGSGPTGLGAMSEISQRNGLSYLRPWLQVTRSQLTAIGKEMTHRLAWEPVNDITNHQDDYTRGALRERLSPHLNERWPGWQKVLGRHARLSQDANLVLNEVAEQDLKTISADDANDGGFSLKAWRELSFARQALVLRYWLEQAALKMPTEARLNDLMRQMRQLHALGFDRRMQVKHDGCVIIGTRGRVILQRHSETDHNATQPTARKSLE